MDPTASPAPNLFDRSTFEAFIGELPAASIVRQWGDSSVAKVGGKIFALQGNTATGEASLSFKCTELSYEVLIQMEGVRPAPYLARAKWVAVERGALTNAEVAAYVTEAHRLVVARLTLKLRRELGL